MFQVALTSRSFGMHQRVVLKEEAPRRQVAMPRRPGPNLRDILEARGRMTVPNQEKPGGKEPGSVKAGSVAAGSGNSMAEMIADREARSFDLELIDEGLFGRTYEGPMRKKAKSDRPGSESMEEMIAAAEAQLTESREGQRLSSWQGTAGEWYVQRGRDPRDADFYFYPLSVQKNGGFKGIHAQMTGGAKNGSVTKREAGESLPTKHAGDQPASLWSMVKEADVPAKVRSKVQAKLD